MSKVEPNGPYIVMRFYYQAAFYFLIERDGDVIQNRLHEVPRMLRLKELGPHIAPLGETAGDAPWQIFRNYLDVLEVKIAEIVQRHSPSFWLHLHRRIKPMLSPEHIGKTDANTVHLVRQIAELAYAKHGDLSIKDDLGTVLGMRLESFMDGIWYEATAKTLHSKLKAKKEFQRLKFSSQVVMTDFEAGDLHDVFGIEGLCYEYWWASAVMRSIGKGSPIKWQNEPPLVLYSDQPVHPLCFEIYDDRINRGGGFHTRSGTWTNIQHGEAEDKAVGDDIFIAQLAPNSKPEEYAAWNPQAREMGQGYGPVNFHLGSLPFTDFRTNNGFMAAAFEKKHGVSLDAVMFAVWSAAFFGIYTGLTARLPTKQERFARTASNWTNLQFRGYAVTPLGLHRFAEEAADWAKSLNLKLQLDAAEALKGLNFIALDPQDQNNIALWSGGKRPILIPSFEGLMIDLAAIVPFLYTLFFGLRKVDQLGGLAFEDAVRNGITGRDLEIHHKGRMIWSKGEIREVDAAVRIGDRLIIVECFTYELPLDFEIGKPSIFDVRKDFILSKATQAESLAKRLIEAPKGANFDVSWAKDIEWRVTSPFVEFAWTLDEPLIDAHGVPRVMQVQELLNYLEKGTNPIAAYVKLFKQIRAAPISEARWC